MSQYPPPPPPRIRPYPVGVWGAGLALLTFLTTMLVAMFTAGVPTLIGEAKGGSAKPFFNAAGLGIQNTVMALGAILFLFLTAKATKASDFGLRKSPYRWWKVVLAVGLAIGLFAGGSALLAELLGLGEIKEDLPQKLGANESLAGAIVLAGGATIFAPLGEELLMRAVVYRGLRNSFRNFNWPKFVAILYAAIISGSMFGVLHIGGSNIKFIPVLIFIGIMLALVYEWTKTLFVPIALHSTNNAIAMTSSMDWKWYYGVLLWLVSLVTLFLIWLLIKRLFSLLQKAAP